MTYRKKMIDQILVEPWCPLFNMDDGPETRARLIPDLRDTVRFEITNVERYLSSQTVGQRKRAQGAFVAAPPFPSMWFEFYVDKWRTARDVHPGDGSPYGAINLDRDLDNPHMAKRQQIGWKIHAVPIEHLMRSHPDIVARYARQTTITTETAWLFMGTEWCRYTLKTGREFVLGPTYQISMPVNKDGSVEGFIPSPYFDRERWNTDQETFPKMKNSDVADVQSKFMPVLFALTFMNCRNVVHETVEPPEKLSRKHEKRIGEPLTTYRVLKVDPGSTLHVRHHEGNHESRGEMPLHICRGHFRVYTAERPLFGHYVGPVWVPAHVRGSERAGTMVKDYEIL